MNTFAAVVVVIAGLWLIGLAVVAIVKARECKEFLREVCEFCFHAFS